MLLYDWQVECLEKWAENRYKGIVNVVTGAGKTVLAITAIQRLEESLKGQILKVKIIVPNTFLVRQWLYALKDILKVPRHEIGIFLGSHKNKPDRRYMIYVVNSARYTFTRHMLDDTDNHVFIIADECHHYGTEENSKIFDFFKIIPNYTQCYTLGLSATPQCKNYENILVPSLGQEIYRFTFSQALAANIISRFSVLNICLEFSTIERGEYDELSEKLSKSLLKLRAYCPQLYLQNSQRFFAAIDNIIKTHKNPDISELAQAVLFLSYQRKEIVYLASARVKCVIDLVKLIDRTSKIIIFGERIEMANEIYEKLSELLPNEIGIYHSGIHKNVGKTALREFEDSQIRILVSCRTLDEGLNVSDTDVGIIVSSTSSTRQRIQRLGRVLRKKESEKQAYFYYLYVRDTMEETEVFHELGDDLSNNINIIDLYYDEKTGEFTNPYYEELTRATIATAERKSWDMDKIMELQRNIELGVIVCDWWMTEKECVRKINKADSKAERNYYVTMLYLIRTRLSQLNID